MDLSEFDFHLPDERIALRPSEQREACKLLVVDRGGLRDQYFYEMGSFLKPGDLLVANDTKVIPALLFGERAARDEQGRDVAVQTNLLERVSQTDWACLCRPGRRLKVGDVIRFPHSLNGEILAKGDEGRVTLRMNLVDEAFWSAIEAIGKMPIPPYIAKQRPSDDADHTDYQTVYADAAGSVAAPTAGLHFTRELIDGLREQGIGFETLTLHVGAGTFAGLTEEHLKSGRLHSEYYEVHPHTIRKIRETRTQGGRVIAIGTTALRTLETIADQLDSDKTLSGTTDIFIRPGYQFRCINALITNFHLPRSSLFMLICALMGQKRMQEAYAHAIASDYRFYSYGDACLLIPEDD